MIGELEEGHSGKVTWVRLSDRRFNRAKEQKSYLEQMNIGFFQLKIPFP